MRKVCISFLIVAIIFLSGLAVMLPQNQTHEEYLRIHIRANSNADIDQSVKYAVKGAVVEYLTPFIAKCSTKAQAESMLNGSLKEICVVADKVLKDSGFTYGSRAEVRREEFPTRVYGEFELEKGFYDALIIELGDGAGDNWWCVVYPPLCFTGRDAGYRYKSKIAQIILDFKNRLKDKEMCK